MKKISTREYKELRTELNNILNDSWDPIHVVEDGILDEYVSYVDRFLSVLVNKGPDKSELCRVVETAVLEMGFSPIAEESDRVSSIVIDWWNIKQEQEQ